MLIAAFPQTTSAHAFISMDKHHGAERHPYLAPPPDFSVSTTIGMKDGVAKYKPAFAMWLASPTHETGVPYREWPALNTVDRAAVLGWVLKLSDCCTTTRQRFESAIFELEMSIYNLDQALITTKTIADYLAALRNAQIVGHALSVPQFACSNAIGNMRLLVADMLNVMPPSVMRDGLGDKFVNSENEENNREVNTRQILTQLSQNGGEGKAKHTLQMYVQCMRERLARWDELKSRLEDWAAQSINSWA
ncbi:hypothetical protein J1614_007733 [Plenodomus biglobosus]|nr:hypothetical protein J1614_007733 [Plenodomus biglobosus]